jgi:hypothetical protein
VHGALSLAVAGAVDYVIWHDHGQGVPPLHASRVCHVSMLWRRHPRRIDCALLLHWEPGRGRCGMCRRCRCSRISHAGGHWRRQMHVLLQTTIRNPLFVSHTNSRLTVAPSRAVTNIAACPTNAHVQFHHAPVAAPKIRLNGRAPAPCTSTCHHPTPQCPAACWCGPTLWRAAPGPSLQLSNGAAFMLEPEQL